MKRFVSIVLVLVIMISSTFGQNVFASDELIEPNAEIENLSLNDPKLLDYLESTVYDQLIDDLNSEEYFIENVSTVYISQEYLEEVAYNSQSNIYFGYTLSDLNEAFQGSKYVFTLSEDGQTTVKELEEITDDSFNQVLKNVAIGGGVILICVTVSAVTSGAAPAVSAIFAASAKTGTIMALSSGVISGASAGIVRGLETQSLDEALKTAAVAGSEGFKWGAISGAIAGGASEAIALKGATLNGLTMDEAAIIQKESGYPLDVIKQFKSVDEYNIYKNAGLKVSRVGYKSALIRNIDLNYKTTFPNGETMTNLKAMSQGYAPRYIDASSGKELVYQLHHVNQNPEGTLAILTGAEHQGNSAILNIFGKESEIDRQAFNLVRKQFWMDFAKMVG